MDEMAAAFDEIKEEGRTPSPVERQSSAAIEKQGAPTLFCFCSHPTTV